MCYFGQKKQAKSTSVDKEYIYFTMKLVFSLLGDIAMEVVREKKREPVKCQMTLASG